MGIIDGDGARGCQESIASHSADGYRSYDDEGYDLSEIIAFQRSDRSLGIAVAFPKEKNHCHSEDDEIPVADDFRPDNAFKIVVALEFLKKSH